jgi:acyl-CoA thioesterase
VTALIESTHRWPYVPMESTSDGYGMAVTEDVCGAAGWLFGGWGLGLLTDAAQRAAERPLQDLSATFLRPVALDHELRMRCTLLAAGRELRYYRVDAFDGDQLALTATAVAGPPVAAGEPSRRAPIAPPPEECPPRPYFAAESSPERKTPGVSVLLDVRTAGEVLDQGLASTMLLWARVKLDLPDAVRLAVFSDHVPYLVRRVVHDASRVSTVTSSLRITGGPATEWVLLEVSLQALAGRSLVGRMDLWSADGRPLAVAEQTNRLTYR